MFIDMFKHKNHHSLSSIEHHVACQQGILHASLTRNGFVARLRGPSAQPCILASQLQQL